LAENLQREEKERRDARSAREINILAVFLTVRDKNAPADERPARAERAD